MIENSSMNIIAIRTGFLTDNLKCKFNMLPLVTVIVATRNEEKNIEDCFKAVHAQTIPREQLEIVLIDNNSTDRTKEISKPYVDEIYNVGPERSAQRNYGFEHAKAEWVLYLDADMRLEPTVIEECIAVVKSAPEIIGFYIPEKVVGNGFWINVRNFERSFYDATCIDAARFIKKKSFLEAGGFDTSMSGPEDWDLDRRLLEKGKLALIKSHLNHDEGAFSFKTYFGKKKSFLEAGGFDTQLSAAEDWDLDRRLTKKGEFALIKSHLNHDEGAFSFKSYFAKKTYYSQWFNTYINKWNNDEIAQKQFGFYYRFIGVFIENGKWKKLIRHPLLASGMYFLRFSVGLVFLMSKLKPGNRTKDKNSSENF